MNERQVLCPVCGSNEVRVVPMARRVRAQDGTELEFTVSITKCGRCGEEFYTREQSLASSRASAATLREREGLLSPDRIRAIRDFYGLTQAEFEKALRLGPKTVVRWESGTVRQGATANSLLLAIEGNPVAFAKVAEANGLEPATLGVSGYTIVSKVVSGSTSVAREPIQFRNFRKVKPVPPKKAAMG